MNAVPPCIVSLLPEARLLACNNAEQRVGYALENCRAACRTHTSGCRNSKARPACKKRLGQLPTSVRMHCTVTLRCVRNELNYGSGLLNVAMCCYLLRLKPPHFLALRTHATWSIRTSIHTSIALLQTNTQLGRNLFRDHTLLIALGKTYKRWH